MKIFPIIFLAVSAVLLDACSQGGVEPMSNTEMPTNQDTIIYIGEARMEDNGDIIITFHKTGDGIHTSAQFRCKPGTERYENVIKHVGGLKPGESKLVPPWPDN
jgi:hypothetical protein